MQPRPFTLRVPQADLDDLATRLARTRWPSVPAGWDGGVDPGWLTDLVEHWRTEFDWRGRERVINRHQKWREWSDCGGDIERRFSRDELLTTVALYRFTGTALSSVHAYADLALATASVPGHVELYPDAPPGGDGPPLPGGRRIDVPAGLLCQVGYDPPASWARRAYSDLRHRTQAARGGHFMATEEPGLLAADLRSFFRPLRDLRVRRP